ncbi:DUF1771-domain-containing protein [Ustulina deusta]|nr:DUF1771-domain-containing protein [Ustulina deusta]KAI3344017.1 DUF1771-domain-containing protein [Ustulina deusta]
MSAGIELDHYERGFDRLGGKVFNHDVHPDKEKKCITLREKAWAEVAERKRCMEHAHEAYERGDGATAKQLSNEGKRHAAKADGYFEEASDIIFKANNPDNPDTSDTIDLHGQYVAAAEQLVEDRIHKDQQKGKTHLHVIVGKGNHSVDHVQKIKPAVEKLCRNLRLQYETEDNEGRIYVNLQSGDVTHIPASPHHGGHQGHPQQYYPGQQGQHSGGQNQQEEDYDEIEKFVTNLFKKYCCTVM